MSAWTSCACFTPASVTSIGRVHFLFAWWMLAGLVESRGGDFFIIDPLVTDQIPVFPIGNLTYTAIHGILLLMVRTTVLASGSKGNSTIVSSSRTRILVDAGLSCRELFKRMQLVGE